MKKRIVGLTLLCSGLSMVFAQEPLPPPPPDLPPGEMGPPPMREDTPMAERGDHMQGKFVDRLLSAIREKNPTEADRLEKLRASDPEAFRQELKKKVIEFRRTPPPGRSRRDMPEGARGGRREGDRPDAHPEMQKIREMAQQYRAAATDQDKQQIRLSLREEIIRLFDERQKFRRERIARFEKELEAMKKELEKIDADRESFVDRRINDILREQPPTPPSEEPPPSA